METHKETALYIGGFCFLFRKEAAKKGLLVNREARNTKRGNLKGSNLLTYCFFFFFFFLSITVVVHVVFIDQCNQTTG